MSCSRFFLVVALVGLGAATTVRAQAVPLAAATPTLELGLEHLAGPVARLGFSPEGDALVIGRVDVGARVVGVALGGQWQQRLWGPLSLREVATVGPFVSALGAPAAGVAGELLLQLGVDIGDVAVVVGPRVAGNALLQGPVPGRGVLDAVVGVKVPFSDGFAVTASASAGAERSHTGFAPGGSSLAGGLALGVQWRP